MNKRSLLVAVTGGAVDKGYTFNSSGLIRDALPNNIKREGKQLIEILKYPHGTICSYESERAILPTLWNGKRSVYQPGSSPDETISIDLMLHMGMAGKTSTFFAIEKVARRDVYTRPGDDGKYLPPGDSEKGGVWEGVPETLASGFDIDSARDIVAKEVPDADVRVSENAGAYFCEFEFFSSLAECYKRKEFARVEFLHTPQTNSPEDIEKGARVAVAVICALLESKRD